MHRVPVHGPGGGPRLTGLAVPVGECQAAPRSRMLPSRSVRTRWRRSSVCRAGSRGRFHRLVLSRTAARSLGPRMDRRSMLPTRPSPWAGEEGARTRLRTESASTGPQASTGPLVGERGTEEQITLTAIVGYRDGGLGGFRIMRPRETPRPESGRRSRAGAFRTRGTRSSGWWSFRRSGSHPRRRLQGRRRH